MSSIYSDILHYKSHDGGKAPAVTPVYQTSAFEATSPYFYTRKNNPNSEELEEIIRAIDYANFAISTATGMTAIFMCLNLLHEGNRVLLASKIYGCSFKLFQKYCNFHSIELNIVDLSDENAIHSLNDAKYDMCFFETPTNPFLSTITISDVSQILKKVNKNCLIVVDNTWATPLFQNPLQHGADLCVYSGTKYFGGHSDVMSGFITTNNDKLYERLRDIRFYGGLILSPESAWLVRRSMQTFRARIVTQSQTTKEMAEWLQTMPFVKKVYYPKIDKLQLRDYGGIVFIEVDSKTEKRYGEILTKLKLFGTGTGMACVTSMIAQPYSGSHASLTNEEKYEMGITPALLRLCFGLEDVEDLKEDLQNAFDH